MLASAFVAYIFGPAWGFAFAVVVGSLCGITFALSATGRGGEIESRALVRLGPPVDRLLARVVVPAAQRVKAVWAKAKAKTSRPRIDPDAVIELGDLDLELGTNP
jgi:hypothetical protein